MQDIKAWLLGSRDYDQGVELYAKYGKSSYLKSLFAKEQTPFNIQKLESELEKLRPAQPATKEVILATETKSAPEVDIPDQPQPAAEVFDPVQQEKYLAIKDDISFKYKQIERNMSLLEFSKSEAVLHQAAKTILSLHSKIQDHYKMIDYYDQRGHFPFEKPVPANKHEEYQKLHESISKAKRRLKSGKCRNVDKTEALIKENTERLKLLMGGTDE